MKLAQGDWVLYEFGVYQVKRLKPFPELSNAIIATMPCDAEGQCRPLTLRGLAIAKSFEGVSQEIHKKGHGGLNYPDIHRWLCEKWLQAYDTPDTPDDKALEPIWRELREFKDYFTSDQGMSPYGFPKNRPVR